MKDAKGHGSNSRGGTFGRRSSGIGEDPMGPPVRSNNVFGKRSFVPAAHQAGILDALKSPKNLAKIGGALYAAQAAAGTLGGVAWALHHTGVM